MMAKREYEFTLILSGVQELTPRVLDAFYEAGCSDALFGMREGVAYAEFARESDSLLDALLSAIRDVEVAGVGAKVEHVEPDELVTMSDIARRLEVTREGVRKWVAGLRGPGNFPPPAGGLTGRSPLWHWTDVVQWGVENHVAALQQEQDVTGFLAFGKHIVALNAALSLRRCAPLDEATRLFQSIVASNAMAEQEPKRVRQAEAAARASDIRPRTSRRTSMARLFSYCLRWDKGVAPNPFWGFCTLVVCKPQIRRAAAVGDWVVGTGSSNSPVGDLSGHLVYAMRVSQKLTMREYEEFVRRHCPGKVPDWSNPDPRRRLGDAIYDFSCDPPRVRNSVHTEAHRGRDLGGGYALVSDHFFYFGDQSPRLPDHLRGLARQGPGHQSDANQALLGPFLDWLHREGWEPNRLYGKPQVRLVESEAVEAGGPGCGPAGPADRRAQERSMRSDCGPPGRPARGRRGRSGDC
jgi:hypothetical protein